MSGHSILVDGMIYLAAAVVFVSLAARLKLGSVLGYLAAGCCIGPFGLRMMREPEATLHFAEIGANSIQSTSGVCAGVYSVAAAYSSSRVQFRSGWQGWDLG
jgi:predicted Kef-type K+ transport protein